MAIANKLTSIMPAFGAPTEYITSLAQNLPASATTPFALTGFTNFVRSGRVRVKSTVSGLSAITSIAITGTDGVNTVTLLPASFGLAASTNFDILWSFISELNLTTVTVTIITGAGGAATIDLEITGNP